MTRKRNYKHEVKFSSVVSNNRSFSKIPEEKKAVGDGKFVYLGFVLFCLLIYIEVMSEAFFLRMIRNLRFLSAK